MKESFLNGKVTLWPGDCLQVLAGFENNSFDSCVCDPPYHLTSIVKRFGGENAAPALSATQRRFAKTGGADRQPGPDQYGRLSTGFMGQQWDGGDVAFRPETWRAVYRVLKPGGYLLAFSGTRTYHRMACAIEDAGFEVRDMVSWIYGSGFPKSHDVSKGIDKASGTKGKEHYSGPNHKNEVYGEGMGGGFTNAPYEPATDAAREWQAWGTALKPALEPICMARKPLIGTVAANVLKWGTGAINVDGCRVQATDKTPAPVGQYGGSTIGPSGHSGVRDGSSDKLGRWPANVIHDGSEEVTASFPDNNGGTASGYNWDESNNDNSTHVTKNIKSGVHFGDSGSAARFFYSSKADADDRIGSSHPTVKPIDLMQYLVRLVTQPGGVVLDCFAGTGTLGEAAWREGMSAVLIEAETEYQADIRRRMALCLAGPDERARESAKARMNGKPPDHGPLFSYGQTSNDDVSETRQGYEVAKAAE